MFFDKEKILAFLPHRDPFLFIDWVEKVELDGRIVNNDIFESTKDLIGTKITAGYRTREDHPIFAGHFPGNAILPGVVQVEMMAQATSFSMSLVKGNVGLKLDVALLGIENAKFRRPIRPEMDLVIKTECIKVRGHILAHDCELYHEGQLMSQSSILASVGK